MDYQEKTVETRIRKKLEAAFSPDELQVINESHQHNVPEGSESHFKLLIVSHSFEGLRPIKRQQSVYQVLAEELAGGVHALTMQTLTAAEWQADQTISASPNCMGGSQHK